MKENEAAKKLYEELTKVARFLEADKPVLRGNIILWDGPFEWTLSMTGGASVIGAEVEGYPGCSRWCEPLACEKGLHKTLVEIEDAGGVVECENSWSVGVYI